MFGFLRPHRAETGEHWLSTLKRPLKPVRLLLNYSAQSSSPIGGLPGCPSANRYDPSEDSPAFCRAPLRSVRKHRSHP